MQLPDDQPIYRCPIFYLGIKAVKSLDSVPEGNVTALVRLVPGVLYF